MDMSFKRRMTVQFFTGPGRKTERKGRKRGKGYKGSWISSCLEDLSLAAPIRSSFRIHQDSIILPAIYHISYIIFISITMFRSTTIAVVAGLLVSSALAQSSSVTLYTWGNPTELGTSQGNEGNCVSLDGAFGVPNSQKTAIQLTVPQEDDCGSFFPFSFALVLSRRREY